MQCDQFERRLNRLLDLRKPPERDSVLAAHSLICPACHEKLHVQAAMLDLLGHHDPPALSAEFANRVAASAVRPRQLVRTAAMIAASLLLLAALLVAVPSTSSTRHARPSQPERYVSADPAPFSDRTGMPVQAATTLVDTQDIVDTEDIEDARPDSAPAAESYTMLWDEGVAPLVTEMSREPLSEIDELASGVRPITHSFYVAIKALRGALPG